MKLAALLAMIALGCGQKSGPAGKPPVAAERDSCTADEDCALVEACCGCNAGGRRVAIRKDAVAEYDATRAKRCADSACTTVISDHSSCNAEATCEAGRCNVQAHMGKQ